MPTIRVLTIAEVIVQTSYLSAFIQEIYLYPWIRVNELYYFLTRNKYAVEVPNLSSLNEGDIIQFFSNSKGFFAHSGIITNILDSGEILYSCHSYDKLNYPLSEIYPILYSRLRLIKIIF